MTAAILTNVVFWSGVAIGGVVFAALLEVTRAEWSGPLRLTAERFRWFLPISFAAMVALMWRSKYALRVDLACAVVYISAFLFCRAARTSRERAGNHAPGAATRSAVVFLLIYALGYSLVVVDTIMSLEPEWTSTLFPAFVFTGNVYCGIAAVAGLAAWNLGVPGDALSRPRSRDVANLLVGMALFWFYLFWSQFLVIWYGNLPSEVRFMTPRLGDLRVVAWTVFVACCALPAIVFIPRWGKRAETIKVLAPLILAGMWLERWLLVAPAVPSRSTISSILVTLGFAAVFLMLMTGRSAAPDRVT
jgi:hypothetical protein